MYLCMAYLTQEYQVVIPDAAALIDGLDVVIGKTWLAANSAYLAKCTINFGFFVAYQMPCCRYDAALLRTFWAPLCASPC